MRSIIVVLFVFSCSISSNCQNLNLVEGQIYKPENRAIFYTSIGDDIVSLSVSKSLSGVPSKAFEQYRLCLPDRNCELKENTSIYITFLDSSLQSESKLKVPIETRDKVSIYEFHAFENQLFLYYSVFNKSKKEKVFYVMNLNIEEINNSKEHILFIESNFEFEEEYEFKFSSDFSKYTIASFREDGIFSTRIFNTSDNSPIGQHKLNTYKEGEKIWPEELQVSNNGLVTIVYKDFVKGQMHKSVKKKGKKVPGYSQKIVVFNKDRVEEIEVSLKMNYIQLCNIDFSQDEIVVCGTYRKKDGGNIVGVYTKKYDLSSLEETFSLTSKFTKQIVSQYKRNKKGSLKKKDFGISARYAKGKIVKLVGSELLYIVEPYLRSSYATKSRLNGVKTSGSNLRASSIIVARINDDIEFNVIPRSLRGAPKFSSLRSGILKEKENVFLLFFDHRDNIGVEEKDNTFKLKEFYKLKDRALIAVNLNDKLFKKKVLLDLKQEKFNFSIRNIQYVGKHGYLFPGVEKENWLGSDKKKKNYVLTLNR